MEPAMLDLVLPNVTIHVEGLIGLLALWLVCCLVLWMQKR
jgi:hypothetical protein